MKEVPFHELGTADVHVDAIYGSSSDGLIAGEPIATLLPGVGNMGGFRCIGREPNKKLVVMFSTGDNKDWPDSLDPSTGEFVYFGDNRTPGHELHQTKKGGNKVLRTVFDLLHGKPSDRRRIPPCLIFHKFPTPTGSRSVQFKGLAVPGALGMPATEDLVAVWKSSQGQRFQNYRAVFTVLDVANVSRAWLNDVISGNPHTENAPDAWVKWVEDGHYEPLIAEATIEIRTKEEQIPATELEKSVLRTVWSYFHGDDEFRNRRLATLFEHFAARLFQLHDRRAIVDEVTRASIDGGRDAVGRYVLGLLDDPVYVDFALEAKCYRPPIDGLEPNTVGVKEVARLVSRLRHRQFGVLVTTSVVARQAYQEIREDKHPIVLICGRDISNILIKAGYNTPDILQRFLQSEFPLQESLPNG